jgi:hypothetical protein
MIAFLKLILIYKLKGARHPAFLRILPTKCDPSTDKGANSTNHTQISLPILTGRNPHQPDVFKMLLLWWPSGCSRREQLPIAKLVEQAPHLYMCTRWCCTQVYLKLILARPKCSYRRPPVTVAKSSLRCKNVSCQAHILPHWSVWIVDTLDRHWSLCPEQAASIVQSSVSFTVQ